MDRQTRAGEGRSPARTFSHYHGHTGEYFRSMNGQIEYLLTECVKHRKGKRDL
ncbi:hypothetical protein [Lachnoclostridium phocaeense]|uniref:hypothetical protein n=1 Tax=Lachnoclostridium phocaeense TaxID=1871021 RepID=UPI00248ED5B2|nr:hypothetical protein [Lachnoclostridium phocaeense]